MLTTWTEVAHLLRHPRTGRPLAEGTGRLGDSDVDFVDDQPILVRPDSAFVDYPALVSRGATSQVKRRKAWQRLAEVRRSIGRSSDGISSEVPLLLSHLRSIHDRKPTLLVIGGGTVGFGLDGLLDDETIAVVSFDVYPSANTTFIGDAHEMMIENNTVDAVWIQAVLEHVQDPNRVVAEIERVLRPNGLVLAETPFLQPVHEGPFDFTRYTLSGHRLLFQNFAEVSSGPIGGPGSMMALALRGLAGGILRSVKAERPVFVLAGVLALLDRFVAERWRRDFATGCYFVGKLENPLSPPDPVEIYLGRQRA